MFRSKLVTPAATWICDRNKRKTSLWKCFDRTLQKGETWTRPPEMNIVSSSCFPRTKRRVWNCTKACSGQILACQWVSSRLFSQMHVPHLWRQSSNQEVIDQEQDVAPGQRLAVRLSEASRCCCSVKSIWKIKAWLFQSMIFAFCLKILMPNRYGRFQLASYQENILFFMWIFARNKVFRWM